MLFLLAIVKLLLVELFQRLTLFLKSKESILFPVYHLHATNIINNVLLRRINPTEDIHDVSIHDL